MNVAWPNLYLLTALMGLAACSVGPQYQAPDVAPIQLASAQAQAFARADMPLPPAWWTFFDDRQLEQLIATAVASNHDIRVARANLLLARASLDQAERARLPVVTSGLAYQRSRAQPPTAGERPARALSESWRAGLDLQWELDLFGRLDHLSRAAQARAEVSQADLEQVRLSIAAQVAHAYFAVQGQRQQLVLARDEIRSWQATTALAEAQLQAGSGLPEHRESARSQLVQAQAAIAPLEASLQASLYRLAVLCGQRPGSLAVEPGAWPNLPLARQLPLGDVDALIRQRPDVVRAERLLSARVEEQGAATADLYPRLNLGGFIGFVALRDSDLGSAARAFELAPGLSWPAFDLGTLRARLRGAQALSQGEAARFEHVLLQAMEEVEGAVTQLAQHQRHLLLMVQAARHGEAAFDIAQQRYGAGAGSYLAVLESQRDLLRTRQAIALAQTASYRTVVDLYKALAWRTPAG
ncbi:TolC family protein [Pseudomonas sp. MAFF212427]|uniref:TolC family protein n=2 Tax=Pseudomonas brassicae TaxID=2708063 RepID=A0A6B3NWW2_9PSED|nr:TolC family protein [Pseudomonas brassicae]NER64097.1 TolC family protein [Pseudomonas brassicae]